MSLHHLNFNIKSHNGHYLCDEGNTGKQPVNCTRNKAGPWETFTVDWGKQTALFSGIEVTIKSLGHPNLLIKRDHNHLFFDAKDANVDTRFAFEVIDPKTFQILPKATHINTLAGQTVAIRAPDGKYVCAEGGGGGAVVANRDHPREWECFKLEVATYGERSDD